jgi:hypothetical protein
MHGTNYKIVAHQRPGRNHLVLKERRIDARDLQCPRIFAVPCFDCDRSRPDLIEVPELLRMVG